MVSTQSLLHAAASEVTLERVKTLVQQAGSEAPTIEYKEKMATTIAKGIVAMANTYGGLMLVGVSDDRRILGVGEKTAEAVAEHCAAQIEPSWIPEIISVALDAAADKHVLVLRVIPGHHPLPLLHRGVAYVRHQNTTHPADWRRLRELCAAQDGPDTADPRDAVRRPSLPQAPSGEPDQGVDLVIKTGLLCPVSAEARWRPMPENDVEGYISALDRSPLTSVLPRLGFSDARSIYTWGFQRRGRNRSHFVQLHWSSAPEGWEAGQPKPAEAVARLGMPGTYGSAVTHLTADIEIVVRLTAWIKAVQEHDGVTGPSIWRITPRDLGNLLDALLATFAGTEIRDVLARLAGIDALAVPQTRALHMLTARPVPDAIDTAGLNEIPDAGVSTGTHLLADPALDLADPGERRVQADRWLEQIALDAGLTGMQRIVQHLAAERP